MEPEIKKPSYSNIFLLGMVSLLNDLSSEMILPILPLLITKIGGTGIAIGLIGGLRDGFANILRPLFGYISDKLNKRIPFLWGGYLTAAVFKVFLFFARAWQHVFIAVGLERIGKSMRTPPRDALISFSLPRHAGQGFGIHRAFDTAGAILGSIIVFFLLWQWNMAIETIILTAALLSFISVTPLYWVKEVQPTNLIPEARLTAPASHSSLNNNVSLVEGADKFSTPLQPTSESLPALNMTIFPNSLKIFMLIATIFSLAHISYMFLMLKANDVFASTLSPLTPIMLYVLYNICYTVSVVPLGILSDKIGRWKMIVGGYGCFALTMRLL